MDEQRGMIRRVLGALWPRGLEERERSSFRLHLWSALLTGASASILHLSDTILAKTLDGTALQVTLLNVIMGGGYLASAFWAGAMRNRPKAPFVLAAAIVGRLGLVLTGLWGRAEWFIAIVGLSWLSDAMIVAAQVSIIQRAYRPQNREHVFGATLSITTFVRLVLTVAVGRALDWNEAIYGAIYAVLGVCGFLGSLLMIRMERRIDYAQPLERRTPLYPPLRERGPMAALRSVRASVGLVVRILREDASFRRFESYFFLYGIAFLSLVPIVPLYLVNDLALDWTQIGLARGLMGQAGLILFSPLMGRLLSGLKPVRFCAWIFGLLSVYPLLLLSAWFVPDALRTTAVYAAFVCFGTAMAGVSLAWNLSSLHFAGEEDPSAYQTVHTVLVGVRGLGAPFLGFAVIRAASNLHGFVLSAALFLLASLLMARMARAAGRVRSGVPTPAERLD
jgi:hypothetical protein